MANYVDTGKVRFIFKDYPINDLSDRASSLAAEGSYCAANQGKHWEYQNDTYSTVAYLHNNHVEGENSGYTTKAFIKQSAGSAGASDMDAFSDCLDSGKYTRLSETTTTLQDRLNLTRRQALSS